MLCQHYQHMVQSSLALREGVINNLEIDLLLSVLLVLKASNTIYAMLIIGITTLFRIVSSPNLSRAFYVFHRLL